MTKTHQDLHDIVNTETIHVITSNSKILIVPIQTKGNVLTKGI